MTPTRRAKLFGTFRSGSNYLKSLLELNFAVVVLSGDGGFKHVPVPAVFEDSVYRAPPWPVLATVKDPYAWLVSMWRYVNDVGSRHTVHGRPWSRFLEEPLVVFQGNVDGFPRYRFASPVDYWNAINYNLLSLPDHVRRVVRYEDVLADPEGECSSIARQLDLARTTAEFVHVARRVRNMDDRERPREVAAYVHDEVFDPTPYRERAYEDMFSRRQRRLVAGALDRAVCRRLGYRR